MRRLLPDPGETSVAEQMRIFDPISRAGGQRPYTFTNFALTVDGRATIEGVSGQIGSGADTEMLVGLRTVADAVLIGSGTMRAERYGRPVADPAKRALRERRGLSADPLMVIVAGALDRLPWDAPLFAADGGPVLLVTPQGGSVPRSASDRVEVLAVPDRRGRVDIAAMVRHLRGERQVRSLLCEGGPTLHAELLEAGLLDEIFVTWAPAIAGGPGPGLFSGLGELRRELALEWLLDDEGELFARYRVSGAR